MTHLTPEEQAAVTSLRDDIQRCASKSAEFASANQPATAEWFFARGQAATIAADAIEERAALAGQVVVLREAIGKLRHWHDWGKNNEGIVVSRKSWDECKEIAELDLPQAAQQVAGWRQAWERENKLCQK